MKDILDRLYYGEIHPGEEGFKKSTGYAKLLKKLVSLEDDVINTMTDSGKEKFREYQETSIDIQSESIHDSFIEGFRLGAQMMLAVLSK